LSDDETPDYSETWSAEALVAKAQRYAERMLVVDRDDWQFALWSSLTLEFLLRAALADYSPALLADAKGDWNNLLSALGYASRKPKFIPKTVGISEVIDRLATLCPELTSELAGFSRLHTTKRNAELHSGATTFDGAKHSAWLPQFYQTCKVLLHDIDKYDLAHVFGKDEAETAQKLIAAFADSAAKAVKAMIATHVKSWADLKQDERTKASTLATLWATKHAGHRVICPACKSDALVTGEPVNAPKKSIDGDFITEKQEHLPNRFECIACSLKVSGLSHLTAAGLGDVYVQTQSYDASDYYSSASEPWEGWEPDNNEPM
jgi:hypothetical protein